MRVQVGRCVGGWVGAVGASAGGQVQVPVGVDMYTGG